jgi:hypothetical protein
VNVSTGSAHWRRRTALEVLYALEVVLRTNVVRLGCRSLEGYRSLEAAHWNQSTGCSWQSYGGRCTVACLWMAVDGCSRPGVATVDIAMEIPLRSLQ